MAKRVYTPKPLPIEAQIARAELQVSDWEKLIEETKLGFEKAKARIARGDDDYGDAGTAFADQDRFASMLASYQTTLDATRAHLADLQAQASTETGL